MAAGRLSDVAHDIRHSFASLLVMRGVSLYKVGKLLGHKDVKTTERYAHLSPESLHEVVAMLYSSDQQKHITPGSSIKMDTKMDTFSNLAALGS